MAFPWAPLISAGAGLLGKIFGGDDDQETTSRIDYKQMVADAEAAGFNPLTAIRNGGSAGYTATSHPALSSGAFIADALGQVGSAIASYNPMDEATAKLEYEIKQATLANLQADTAARLKASVGGVPVSTGARNVAAGSPLATGLPLSPTVEVPTLTNPYGVNTGVSVNPGVPDAAAAEERYGDIMSNIFGVGTFIADMYENMRRYEPPKGGVKHGPDWTEFARPSLARPSTSAPWRPPSLPSNRGW